MINKNVAILILLAGFIASMFFTTTGIAKASESPVGKTTHCRLSIEINPVTKKITGTMDIIADKGRELTIYRNNARLKEFHSPGTKRDIGKEKGEDPFVIRYEGPIQLKYEITIENSEDNIINEKEIVLKTGWYPVVDGFNTYEVRATFPKGFIAISEGESVEMQQLNKKAVMISKLDKPYSDAITIVASKRFVVTKDALDGIDIYTYFFSEHAGQAKIFIEGAKHYIKIYQSLIGKFPYRRFSIVENSLPSAFSVPTFILMTESYIKKDNIKDTPLGHEIVHQWFGNSVFADYEKGNWHEGLTIYFADHLDEEINNQALNCRKRILIGYENYVRDNNEFPLNKFTERFDYASRSIGYGKSAMVFHMLRKRFGDKIFYDTIRHFVKEHSFKVTSWEDIQRAFENTTGEDLSFYFKQWVYDKGIAEIDISDIQTKKRTQGYEVGFSIFQKDKSYRITVPVTFYFKNNKLTKHIDIADKKTSSVFMFDEPPTEIVLDEEYDVFRRLSIRETPPTIERLITDEKSIIVTPASESSIYTELIAAFGEKGSIIQFMKGRPDITRKYGRRGREITTLQDKPDKTPEQELKPWQYQERKKKDDQKARKWVKDRDKDNTAWKRKKTEMQPGFRRQCQERSSQRIKDEDISSASLLVIGLDNPLLKRLKIETHPMDAGFIFVVQKNPFNPRKVIAIAAGVSHEEIKTAQAKVVDYRKYSALSFEKGRLVNKSLEKSDNGIRVILNWENT